MAKYKTMDGNTAAAHVAYAFSEVVALYPITPSTAMGENVDAWASENKKNLFGYPVSVTEMQSEAGAAGTVHGALSGGSFSSTYTASQGLLLMIPNMYKIAGELLPCVFHVAARALAGQALSIFGDHQDVMAARSTGFCFLASNSVQEAMDLALVAHLSTLRASLPFLHFFDGFRTSHEIQKIEEIPYEKMLPLINPKDIERHRMKALNPSSPVLKGSAQNPDVYFQITEASNSFYLAVPIIVQEEMDKVFALTGRQYHLFDYVGHPEADRIIICMGSAAQVVESVINALVKKGEKIGLVKVHLYRPFSLKHFIQAIPPSVKKIAVIEKTKESGALGEPLYMDVCGALRESKRDPLVVGGRCGLGSKDFNNEDVFAVLDNLDLPEPKNHFTVGITDDVTFTSLPKKKRNLIAFEGVECKFWGIGGDGTVGANKDAIKIIGNNTDKFVQGYFAYDSKKTSGLTISHLRFGDHPILASYLVYTPDYVACHHPSYVRKYDVLEGIKEGGIFVLNSPWSLEDMERHVPGSLKRQIAQKKLRFYNIHAEKVAKEVGLGNKINMIMQTAFFELIGILPTEKAIALLKEAIVKEYGRKGNEVVEKNHKAVDMALAHLEQIQYPSSWKDAADEAKPNGNRPPFMQNIADVMIAQKGDSLPVSAFTPGGVFPLGMAGYEKRSIATEIPRWVSENCIQCNQCAFVCPHAAIRPFLLNEQEQKKAPKEYVAIKALGKEMTDYAFSIEVTPWDCTGCGNCVQNCPGMKGKKALELHPIEQEQEKAGKLWDYVSSVPLHQVELSKFTVKGSQFKKPLLEFSGACAGCGETPYLKLLTQLFGERMIVSNATGCSSIWGGSPPCVPWTYTKEGRGPAWSNSLFEDNAEHGLGIYLSYEYARKELIDMVQKSLETPMDGTLQALLKEWLLIQNDGEKSRELSDKIQESLSSLKKEGWVQELWKRKDLFVKPSVWIIGGDGWAYDIGFGGLDHVLAVQKGVKILVLDTEIYSNTGGQASKSTPLGAVAKFAAGGKRTLKKDLGLMAMTYGNVYVASVCLGADKNQLIKAYQEAESFDGPSISLAYSYCIEHGSKIATLEEEKMAVDAGYWFLYRFDPRRKQEGKNPFVLDSKEPTKLMDDFLSLQVRYNFLNRKNPELAKKLHEELSAAQKEKYQMLKRWNESGFGY
ncbi:MAG: pyruvate:ferredoxin (flavodoxin) oxidoreductase [Chlamydiota bacterium]